MSQEIEIEFKTMLREDEFIQLRNTLPFPEQAVIQINHYFETAHFALKDKKAALRIREKEGRYTLTLKEPHELGLLETHDTLSSRDAHEWLQNRAVPQTHTRKQLQQLGINESDLRYYGALTTERYELHEASIDYMLDKSIYHGIIDYELEIEASSKEAGIQALHKLLDETKIVERKADAKIARFFNAAFNN